MSFFFLLHDANMLPNRISLMFCALDCILNTCPAGEDNIDPEEKERRAREAEERVRKEREARWARARTRRGPPVK